MLLLSKFLLFHKPVFAGVVLIRPALLHLPQSTCTSGKFGNKAVEGVEHLFQYSVNVKIVILEIVIQEIL